ncbi:MAG: YggS family pyridoxal phosphate-dependent enzyme, partial [Stackebrandtia sp.]
SLDGDVARGGVSAEAEGPLIEAVVKSAGLRLAGVMAVAPLGWEPRRAFEVLADRAARVRGAVPEATVISAGMSGDFTEAIACGASLLRLGAKLLGPRGDVRYAGLYE